MDEYYERKNKKGLSKEAIIGLGEASFRKNYYPELQQKINDLEQINARNRALIATIPDLLFVSDLEGEIRPISFLAHLDKNLKEEILNDFNIMGILKEGVQEVLLADTLLTKEFQLQSEKTYYFEARFHKTEINEILIIIRDMTDRIVLENQLRDLVEKDTLTGLYNRHSFENKLKQYAGKSLKQIAMVSVDINGLKFINDTLGHLTGDDVIVAAGQFIFDVFGKYGHVARIGGDEFGVILEGIDESLVGVLLDELNKKVERFNLNSESAALSLALGYAYHMEGLVNMDFLYREADNYMYQNKLLKKESIRGTFVKTFMTALEAKDYVSEGHVVRMEKLAVLMAKALSLRPDQIDRIILLTKFHDIGKIGIPDSILKKPEKLTDDEWKVMRTHSVIGERIALEAVEIKDIAPLILKHHEKWDGSGYPVGIAGEEIPMECRILAIVDTFDAMTNDRPYREALSAEEAMEEIQRCSGTQFDPRLVEIFCSVQKNYFAEA